MVGQAVDELSKISDYLEAMTYEACKGPSYGKLNYVLHLQRHLHFLLQLFGPSQETPEEWPKIPKRPFDQQWLAQSRIDREYISDLAEILKKDSEKLQATIKQQTEREEQFAIIAAIYLPLTLATGIFGMNIKQITAATTAPKWQDVIYLGLPLVAVSVAVPLTADRVYQQIQNFAGARPILFRFCYMGCLGFWL